MKDEITVKRLYEVPSDLHAWLVCYSKENRRPVVRQVQWILEKERALKEDREV